MYRGPWREGRLWAGLGLQGPGLPRRAGVFLRVSEGAESRAQVKLAARPLALSPALRTPACWGRTCVPRCPSLQGADPGPQSSRDLHLHPGAPGPRGSETSWARAGLRGRPFLPGTRRCPAPSPCQGSRGRGLGPSGWAGGVPLTLGNCLRDSREVALRMRHYERRNVW